LRQIVTKCRATCNKLLSKDVPFKWTDDSDKAFQLLKDMLTSAPILAFPDMTKPLILTPQIKQNYTYLVLILDLQLVTDQRFETNDLSVRQTFWTIQ
jgi:exopolysaccharide biosynthesis predicted pyruvyltransferase EpsI